MLLIAGAAVYLLPLLWMFSTSLKSSQDVLSFPPQFFPTSWLWQNYPEGWNTLPFGRFTVNTVLVTVLAVVGTLISCVLPAYAFARMRARSRGFLFALTLATMMIPGEVLLVPQFIMFSEAGLVNTLWPLFLPAWFGTAFYIFLLRQFFLTIPRELDDAARLDGASSLRILWSIILPLSKPPLVAVTVFAFVANWNNVIGPIVYLRSLDKYTLAVGLRLFQGQHATDYNHLMAVSMLTIIPIVVVFLLLQRAFIQGVALSGMGGR
ncbi:carbohydrate ABC transporter permease [Jiangella muralis]|uniref:carbohydrate ABC transporter permease n=1 Tax=Jiangella muralis TaxID=702383 RepID=UPI00196A1A09|nr:carbohydrate ABC transporter permease [Jiangella muralis]